MTLYLIKVMICSGVLLLAYHLLLEKEKMFRYNRFYLLLAPIISLVTPVVNFEWHEEKSSFSEPVYIMNELLETTKELIQTTGASEQENTSNIPVVLVIYLVVASVLLVRFTRNLLSLFLQTKSMATVSYNGINLVLLEQKGLPFSFFHSIFVNKNDWHNGTIRPEILHHELTHIRQKHSWDILLLELILVLVWFNPFFYRYKKAIRLNHEYLADLAVVNAFPDKQTYQQLLLHTANCSNHVAMTSSFNYLITKKRLLMMLKTTSPVSVGLRKALTIISTLILVFLVSTKIMAQQEKNTPPQKTTDSKKLDTVKSLAWVGQSIGFTTEGVSNELLKEYQALVAKYFNNHEPRSKQADSITEEDRARMEEIFKQMSPEQQGKQAIAFLKPPKPLPKVTPTKEQFEKFKNPKIYGVWINERKVSIEALNNYNHADFSQVFVSKLYGAAKKGRNYTHQLDLMTNDYYKEYFEEASKNKRSMMVLRSPAKTHISGYE